MTKREKAKRRGCARIFPAISTIMMGKKSVYLFNYIRQIEREHFYAGMLLHSARLFSLAAAAAVAAFDAAFIFSPLHCKLFVPSFRTFRALLCIGTRFLDHPIFVIPFS